MKDIPRRFLSWISLSIALAATLVSVACSSDSSPSGSNTVIGSGVLASESRAVQGFAGVSVSGVGRLDAELTGAESLIITAEDNLLQFLVSQVRGNTLHLGPVPSPNLQGTREILYELTAIELRELALSNATQASVSGLDNVVFAVDASGAWNATAAGQTDRQELTLSGAGNYSAGNLASRITTVNISGSVNLVVRVSQRLEGEISGASRLDYFGDPELVLSITGTATVRRLGS